MLKQGDIIEVEDDLDGLDFGEVICWERDEVYPMILHVYLKSEKPSRNIIIDPRVPEPFWRIYTVMDPDLEMNTEE